MQFLSALNKPAESWKREKAIGDFLPYRAQIDRRTILMRDGRLLQIIELEGLSFETLDSDELNYRKALREATLNTLGSSRFAIYQHVVRRRVEAQLEGEFSDPFSANLDRNWNERLQAKRLYSNRLFLSILRRPLQGKAGVATGLAGLFTKLTRAEREAQLAQERSALNAASEALVSSLAQYGARILEGYEDEGALFSEPIEFLSMLLNGSDAPCIVPDGDIGQYIPRRRVSFGAQSVELGPDVGEARSFVGILSIKDYPGSTSPGFLDDLMRLPFELQISQSFAFVDRQAAQSKINLALRRMRSADDEALSLRDELGVARDAAAAGKLSFGEHHMTIALYGASEDEVAEAVAEAQATLSDAGIVGVREDMALEPAFWAQFPGNFQHIPRRAIVSAKNFASLASMHNFPTGRTAGNHWGPAVTVLETTSAGPYHFNFHQGDLGNFTVIGPSGSGKTVVLNFLLAQSRRFDPRIVFFDKDRGAELFIRAIGGRYEVLRAGRHTSLNPLRLPDSPANRRFLVEWLTQLIGGATVTLLPEEAARLKEAVDANMEAPPQFRRLSHFAQLLKGAQRPHPNDLPSRLAPWWGQGENAWLFDNESDGLDLMEQTVGFDMTTLLDDPIVRTPAMMYLFHRVEHRLDGEPTIIVVDEGWKALDDRAFTSRIRDWEKTIRKRNGIVGFATQSADDALESEIASAIIEQAATQIFMANPKAQAKAYIDGFGLTPHEFDIVRSLPESGRAFLIKHGNDSVVARLDLSGDRELITILSGRERTIRIFDEISGDGSDLPENWLRQLLERAA